MTVYINKYGRNNLKLSYFSWLKKYKIPKEIPKLGPSKWNNYKI